MREPEVLHPAMLSAARLRRLVCMDARQVVQLICTVFEREALEGDCHDAREWLSASGARIVREAPFNPPTMAKPWPPGLLWQHWTGELILTTLDGRAVYRPGLRN